MSDAAPRRLHPATVVLGAVRSAPSIVLGLPAILALTSDLGLARAIGIAVVAAAIAAAGQFLAWRRFTYALVGDALVIESGVLSRNRRTIPFDRVQDVDIEQKPLARLFGLAKVRLETGGAGKDEGALDSVSVAEAQRLRGIIRQRAAAAQQEGVATENEAEAEPPSAKGAPLFAMSLPRVLIWGLFNFSLVWLAVIAGAWQYLDDFLPFGSWRAIGDWVRDDGRAEAARQLGVGAWLGFALVFALLGVTAGLLRTVLRDFGFTLTDEGGRFRRVRGLLTRTEAVIALKRVQLALIETGWLWRAFGWSGMRVQTLGGSGDSGGRQDVAPLARDAEIDAILAPLDLMRPDPADLRQVAHRHVWRMAVRTVGPPLIVLLVAGYFVPKILFALPLLSLPLGVAMLRRRFHRFGLPGDLLYITRGVIARQMWIVPVGKVQAVTVRRSWLQRRFGTATVLPDTAGAGALSHPAIEDIRYGDAWALASQLRARR